MCTWSSERGGVIRERPLTERETDRQRQRQRKKTASPRDSERDEEHARGGGWLIERAYGSGGGVYGSGGGVRTAMSSASSPLYAAARLNRHFWRSCRCWQRHSPAQQCPRRTSHTWCRRWCTLRQQQRCVQWPMKCCDNSCMIRVQAFCLFASFARVHII